MAVFKRKHSQYAKHGAKRPAAPGKPQNDALVETMVIAACVDGLLSPGESDALATQIFATPGFEHLDNKQLARTVEAAATRVASEGIAGRVSAIGHALGRGTALGEEAFLLATLFVLFDGEVGEEEQEFLDLLQRQLGVTDERASHLTALLADSQN